jgi:hypothetical protein
MDAFLGPNITAWSQSYDFCIYNFNASVVVPRLERFYTGETQFLQPIKTLETINCVVNFYNAGVVNRLSLVVLSKKMLKLWFLTFAYMNSGANNRQNLQF